MKKTASRADKKSAALRLERTTLRSLTPATLHEVAGGSHHPGFNENSTLYQWDQGQM